jgi:hypothetical protein
VEEMKTILSIGYTHFALPATANVNAVIALLQKATRVEKRYQDKRYIYTPTSEKEPDIMIEMVSDDCVIDPNKKRKALPEKASP